MRAAFQSEAVIKWTPPCRTAGHVLNETLLKNSTCLWDMALLESRSDGRRGGKRASWRVSNPRHLILVTSHSSSLSYPSLFPNTSTPVGNSPLKSKFETDSSPLSYLIEWYYSSSSLLLTTEMKHFTVYDFQTAVLIPGWAHIEGFQTWGEIMTDWTVYFSWTTLWKSSLLPADHQDTNKSSSKEFSISETADKSCFLLHSTVSQREEGPRTEQ